MKRLTKIKLTKEAKEAVDESNKTKSQEPLEENVSGVSGRPTKHEYHGLRTREKKERGGDLAD